LGFSGERTSHHIGRKFFKVELSHELNWKAFPLY
jgi:hypothetical protein